MKYRYPSQDPIVKLDQEMKLRGFSPKTRKIYLSYVAKVLEHSRKNPKTVTGGDVKEYLLKLTHQKRSHSTISKHFRQQLTASGNI